MTAPEFPEGFDVDEDDYTEEDSIGGDVDRPLPDVEGA